MRGTSALVGIASMAVAATLPSNACAEPMGAQPLIGSRIPTKPRELEPAQAGQIRKDFGRCMYRGYRTKADVLLLNSDPATVDLEAAGLSDKTITREFSMDTCLGQVLTHVPVAARLRFSYQQLRSLLEEEAYLASHDAPPIPASDAVETLDRTFVSAGNDLATARANAAFADCIVFREPAKSDAVMRTMPGTLEERAAARALAPALGECLTQGQTLELKAANIRVFVADGLWTRFVRPAGNVSVTQNTAGVTH